MMKNRFPNKLFSYTDKQYITTNKNKFLFHHIPKTAGSTFRGVLQNLFDHEELCRAETPKELQAAFQAGFTEERLFGGHFSYGAISKYLDDAVWVTFLRNPIERVVSHYYNHTNLERIPEEWKQRLEETPEWKQYVDDVQGVSIEGWINNKNQTVNSIACNRQTQAFLPDSIRVNEKDWGVHNQEYIELAKQNLRENFPFVGIQEYFDLSIDLFSLTFSLNPIDAASYTTNLNTKKTMEKKYDLEQAVLDLVHDRNSMDIELYEYGVSLFFERLHIINQQVIENNRVHTMQLFTTTASLQKGLMKISEVFDTYGFYAMEGEAESLFKWSGYNNPSIIEFLCNFQEKKRYVIELTLLAVIKKDILETLKLYLDNQPLDFNVKEQGSQIIVSSTVNVPDKLLYSGLFHSIKIDSQLILEGEQKGARKLGVALHSIEIKDA
mgnify:CR=1 FL=1